jgi:hypothetical protein
VYDTEGEDIVISGKARKDDGKGYRAITYAAFMVGVLRQANQKHRRHPGFIVMDSPLVTYREPDENMGDGQVIVLENEEPPEDLRNSIAYTAFTKNRNTGRYGLFPPPPTNRTASDCRLAFLFWQVARPKDADDATTWFLRKGCRPNSGVSGHLRDTIPIE